MILINLLPHREAARKRRREIFYAGLGASALAGAVIAGGVYLWYAAQISTQQQRNGVLASEIKRLESQIKDIASLQEEIAALRARQQAVEDLQADRNMPVHLLNELTRQLPDGVYLTAMKQTNDTVAITGVAQSNERVSELLRNLSANSAWVTRPDLVEIVAGNVTLAAKDSRRVSVFKVTVKVLRASEAAKAASAAASAAAAATTTSAVVPAPAPAPNATVAATPAPAKK
ncbi:PilN domain-containing protein [Ramlibacter sp. PS3R-8]|uniref:PilN domain-containing protein n=1 Tax=Ramlibacter sp. PS3R-8 TaxID=3133437 RepID=UPI00309AF038